MLTLYHAPGSTSDRMVWLLEELGADYEIVRTTAGPHAPEGADPNNPHPHGYAPALVHDGHLVTESGAIALYLTDLHPRAGLGPAVGHPDRGEYVRLLFYQVGVAEPLIYMKAKGALAADAAMTGLYDGMMEHLQETLTRQPYLLGDEFSAADLLFMALFEQARPLLADSDVLDAYLARADRPARQRALARN
jgi:glutathione S-transferase